MGQVYVTEIVELRTRTFTRIWFLLHVVKFLVWKHFLSKKIYFLSICLDRKST